MGILADRRPAESRTISIALLLNVTRPLMEEFGRDRVQVYTVPYTAQFHNPLASDQQMSYNDSRAEGRAAVKAITSMNEKCPLTSYVLVGFSQGAVIAGDLASDIGNGRGPVDEDLVLGVTLIADGRRQIGVGQDIRAQPARTGGGGHPERGTGAVGHGVDDDGTAPGVRCARQPHQRDLRSR